MFEQFYFLPLPPPSGGFRVSGFLPPVCAVTVPLRGGVRVEEASRPILSIECKVRRVESVGGAREVREVQSTQVADGDVCEGMDLPIHIILPRLFTCPTLFETWVFSSHHFFYFALFFFVYIFFVFSVLVFVVLFFVFCFLFFVFLFFVVSFSFRFYFSPESSSWSGSTFQP